MGNKTILTLLFLIIIPFNGCLRTYYHAIHESAPAPMIYASTGNHNETSRFLYADLSISKGNYANETVKLAKLAYLYAYTKDNYNFNARGFGYTGLYNVSGISKIYDGEKYLTGLGADVTFGTNFKINKLKVGLGLNCGLGVELGEYSNFRKEAANAGLIAKNNEVIFGMFSVFPVISYEISESTIISTQVNAGFPGGLSPSLVLNINGFVYWISWSPDEKLRHNNYGRRIAAGFLINLDKFSL